MCRQIFGVFFILSCFLLAKEVWAAKSCASYLEVTPHLIERLENRQIALRSRHLPRAWQKVAQMHPIFYGDNEPPKELPSQLLVKRNLKELVDILNWIAAYGVRVVPPARNLLARTSVALAALYWQQQGVDFTFVNDPVSSMPQDVFPWAIKLSELPHCSAANNVACKVYQRYLDLGLTYAPSILLETGSDACYYTKRHQIFLPHGFVLRPSFKNGGILHELRHALTTINLAQRKKFAWYGSVLNTQHVVDKSNVIYSNYHSYFTFDEVLIHYHDLRIELRRLMHAVKDQQHAQIKILRKIFLGLLQDTLSLAFTTRNYLQIAMDIVQTRPERVYFQKVGKVIMSIVNLAVTDDPSPQQIMQLVIPVIKAQDLDGLDNLNLLYTQLAENLAANDRVLQPTSQIIKYARRWSHQDAKLDYEQLHSVLAMLPKIE